LPRVKSSTGFNLAKVAYEICPDLIAATSSKLTGMYASHPRVSFPVAPLWFRHSLLYRWATYLSPSGNVKRVGCDVTDYGSTFFGKWLEDRLQ
ncbi:MAG: hypothetical protein LUF04_10425, partial [Bacteroides sp.]|nr:hypothetical protein [Bacteroides sp.]